MWKLEKRLKKKISSKEEEPERNANLHCQQHHVDKAKRGQLNGSQDRDSDDEPGNAHLPIVNFVIFCFELP